MVKFYNVKKGDKVWSIRFGWGVVKEVNHDECYGLIVSFQHAVSYMHIRFTFDGCEAHNDIYPTLFWNEFHIPNNEEDKKSFDLVEFLKENLKPKEFKINEHNYVFYYNYSDKKLFSHVSCEIEFPTKYFYFIKDEDIDVLNEYNITPKQLKQAYQKLGWI